MKHLSESIVAKKTGVYDRIKTGFPEKFVMYDIGYFMEYLETKGFTRLYLPESVKNLNGVDLRKYFSKNDRSYACGKVVGKYRGSDILSWFAFGGIDGVYVIRILAFDESTGYVECDYELQQSGKITIGFQNYSRFRDSAIQRYGLK